MVVDADEGMKPLEDVTVTAYAYEPSAERLGGKDCPVYAPPLSPQVVSHPNGGFRLSVPARRPLNVVYCKDGYGGKERYSANDTDLEPLALTRMGRISR